VLSFTGTQGAPCPALDVPCNCCQGTDCSPDTGWRQSGSLDQAGLFIKCTCRASLPSERGLLSRSCPESQRFIGRRPSEELFEAHGGNMSAQLQQQFHSGISATSRAVRGGLQLYAPVARHMDVGFPCSNITSAARCVLFISVVLRPCWSSFMSCWSSCGRTTCRRTARHRRSPIAAHITCSARFRVKMVGCDSQNLQEDCFACRGCFGCQRHSTNLVCGCCTLLHLVAPCCTLLHLVAPVLVDVQGIRGDRQIPACAAPA